MLKPEKSLPFTAYTTLFDKVKLLVAVPVPMVIPRPPYPLLFVVVDFATVFRVTVLETKPVSNEIPVGA